MSTPAGSLSLGSGSSLGAGGLAAGGGGAAHSPPFVIRDEGLVLPDVGDDGTGSDTAASFQDCLERSATTNWPYEETGWANLLQEAADDLAAAKVGWATGWVAGSARAAYTKRRGRSRPWLGLSTAP